eukprot:CAMPEP_0179063126 /NCGR_PEP_ID=MMETSP0796-20121207/27276_1 /TAXON_ID=73915 /ORGANISM="Pyrodinium bahamense, Strain pbaha01" /LENGTH=78 /DNA_ID=CAMNT_0020760041 /DNA_START=859 /DNA_END=1092 /DNA_ORIENTATION=+
MVYPMIASPAEPTTLSMPMMIPELRSTKGSNQSPLPLAANARCEPPAAAARHTAAAAATRTQENQELPLQSSSGPPCA